jgi:hypothetical protein
MRNTDEEERELVEGKWSEPIDGKTINEYLRDKLEWQVREGHGRSTPSKSSKGKYPLDSLAHIMDVDVPEETGQSSTHYAKRAHFVPVDDLHPFDLDSYISNYTGNNPYYCRRA